MNAGEWRTVARPVVDDLRACLTEYASVDLSPAGLGGLYRDWRAAADRRDLAAFRLASWRRGTNGSWTTSRRTC